MYAKTGSNIMRHPAKTDVGIKRPDKSLRGVAAIVRPNDKTVVEARGVTTYLPLPEVRRRSQQAPATTVTPPTPVQE